MVDAAVVGAAAVAAADVALEAGSAVEIAPAVVAGSVGGATSRADTCPGFASATPDARHTSHAI